MSGDFDFEPIRGLPGPLPAGERLLWQGAPDLRAVAFRIFHVRAIALYFALLGTWRLGQSSIEGAALTTAIAGALPLLGLGAAALAILFAITCLVCRTTVYSITSRRLIMRIGIALPIHFNLPFAVFEAAALKLHKDGTGTVPLRLSGNNRLAYLVLWPHVRPWHLARAEPALRCIPDAAKVATILGEAVAAAFPDKIALSLVEAQVNPSSPRPAATLKPAAA